MIKLSKEHAENTGKHSPGFLQYLYDRFGTAYIFADGKAVGVEFEEE